MEIREIVRNLLIDKYDVCPDAIDHGYGDILVSNAIGRAIESHLIGEGFSPDKAQAAILEVVRVDGIL